eukprot:5098252-Prymnesium_polylepis.2
MASTGSGRPTSSFTAAASTPRARGASSSRGCRSTIPAPSSRRSRTPTAHGRTSASTAWRRSLPTGG